MRNGKIKNHKEELRCGRGGIYETPLSLGHNAGEGGDRVWDASQPIAHE